MYSEPVAKRKKHEVKFGKISSDRGENLMNPPVIKEDYYHWLRSDTRDDPEVLSYLQSENHYTKSIMQDSELTVKQIFTELKSHINETDDTYPRPKLSWDNPYRYFKRTIEGKCYPIYCRKNLSTQTEEILLDVNELAEGKTNYDVASFEVTRENDLISYGVDETGDEKYRLVIKSLVTGQEIKHTVPELMYCSYFWFYYYIFYEVADETNRLYQIWVYDAMNGNKNMIFENLNTTETVSISMSNDEEYFFITNSSYDTSEIYYFHKYNFDPIIFAPKQKGVIYDVIQHGNKFLIVTNKDNCRNFKIMWCYVDSSTAMENWKEFIPYDDNVYIKDIDTFKDFILITTRENGTNRVKVIHSKDNNYDFKNSYYLDLGASDKNIDLSCLDVYETDRIWLSHEALDTPPTLYEYHLKDKTYTPLKEKKILQFDSSKYHSERIYAKSHDNTLVPMSIVYKKDLFSKNGTNPLYLYGYGAYGSTTDPDFYTTLLPLLNRGFVYVIAHVRGSSFLGYKWYEDGKMEHKINSFKDFIACAEHLINQNYTYSKGITIEGRSAGGLLVGACMTMRPDLFHTVIGGVPFVDALNTMSDPSIPLTTEEWEQWGNPNQQKYYNLISTYSPYDNIKPNNYPHILFLAGLNDPRVGYWEPAKFIAKLRHYRQNNNILLLKTEMDEGHFGGSDRYKYLEQLAFEYAFVLKTYNMC